MILIFLITMFILCLGLLMFIFIKVVSDCEREMQGYYRDLRMTYPYNEKEKRGDF